MDSSFQSYHLVSLHSCLLPVLFFEQDRWQPGRAELSIHHKLYDIGMDSGYEIVALGDEDVIFQAANKQEERTAIKIPI
jgi:hypothetical protein